MNIFTKIFILEKQIKCMSGMQIFSVMSIFQEIDPYSFNADRIEWIVWGILEASLMFLFLAQSLYFFIKFRKGKKKDSLKSIQQFDLGYAFFFFLMLLYQIIYCIDNIPIIDQWIPLNNYDLLHFLQNYFSNGVFIIDYYIVDFPLTHMSMLQMSTFVMSFLFIMYPIEKYLRNRERKTMFYIVILTSIYTNILYIIIFFLGRSLATDGLSGTELYWTYAIPVLNFVLAISIYFILGVVGYSLLLTLYYYMVLIRQSPKGPLRTKALLIWIGFILFYGAQFGNSLVYTHLMDFLLDWNLWIIVLAALMFITGNSILTWGFRKNVL